jgi:hypothetical protein
MITTNAGYIAAIVIVPVIVLAFWLSMMFYVNSHPQWRGQASADADSAHALVGSVPTQRLSSPGPVVPGQRPGTVAGEVTADQPRDGEARR